MTPEDKAVLTDLLLQRGVPMPTIERVMAAAEPGAMVLSSKTVREWQSARHPGVRLTQGAPASAAMYAVPVADRDMLARMDEAASRLPAAWIPPL